MDDLGTALHERSEQLVAPTEAPVAGGLGEWPLPARPALGFLLAGLVG